MNLRAFIQKVPVILSAVLIGIFMATHTLAGVAPPTGLKVVTPYYVSQSGSDSNPGTLELPWRTIQKAANTIQPGGRAVVLSGNYPERVRVQKSNLSFETQGSVDMKGFTVKASGITIRGFRVEADGCNWQDGWGIFVQGSNALVEDNSLFNNCSGGIIFFANRSSDPGTSNNVARNNRAQRNGQVGIQAEGQNAIIDGNEVWDTLQYHPKWGTAAPTWVDADGMRFFGTGHIFRNNYIHDISWNPPENVNPHTDCFQSWGPASNILIEYNRCILPFEEPSTNDGAQGFMLEGPSMSNITIRRNVIDAFRNINSSDVDGLTVINNCLLSSLSYTHTYQTVFVLLRVTNAVFKNNVVRDLKFHYVSNNQSTLNAGYNSVSRSDSGTLPGSPFPKDLWGINPLLNNSCSPLPGSPLIDAGTDVGLPYQGVTADIGAYEIK